MSRNVVTNIIGSKCVYFYLSGIQASTEEPFELTFEGKVLCTLKNSIDPSRLVQYDGRLPEKQNSYTFTVGVPKKNFKHVQHLSAVEDGTHVRLSFFDGNIKIEPSIQPFFRALEEGDSAHIFRQVKLLIQGPIQSPFKVLLGSTRGLLSDVFELGNILRSDETMSVLIDLPEEDTGITMKLVDSVDGDLVLAKKKFHFKDGVLFRVLQQLNVVNASGLMMTMIEQSQDEALFQELRQKEKIAVKMYMINMKADVEHPIKMYLNGREFNEIREITNDVMGTVVEVEALPAGDFSSLSMTSTKNTNKITFRLKVSIPLLSLIEEREFSVGKGTIILLDGNKGWQQTNKDFEFKVASVDTHQSAIATTTTTVNEQPIKVIHASEMCKMKEVDFKKEIEFQLLEQEQQKQEEEKEQQHDEKKRNEEIQG